MNKFNNTPEGAQLVNHMDEQWIFGLLNKCLFLPNLGNFMMFLEPIQVTYQMNQLFKEIPKIGKKISFT